MKIRDVVNSYQSELVDELFGWDSLDFLLHRYMIQYFSVDHMDHFYETSTRIIDYLIENNIESKQVLNIGTGIGLLEAVGRSKEYNIDCTEMKVLSAKDGKLVPNFDPFGFIRSKLNSKVTYWTNSIFDDNYIINNCQQKYDYGMLVRFTPLTQDCDSNNDVKLIFNNLKKYVNDLLIIDDVRNIAMTSDRNFLKNYEVKMLYKYDALYHVPLNNIITQN